MSDAVTPTDPLLNRILEGLPFGAVMIDASFNISAVNSMAARLLEIDPRAVTVGIPLVEVVRYLAKRGDYGEGDLEGAAALVMSQIEHDAFETFTEVTPSGTKLAISIRRVDGGGRLITIEDVTDSHTERENLARTADQMRRLLDSSPVAVAIVGSGGRLLYVNKRHDELYGATADQLPKNARDLYVDPSERDRLLEIFRRDGVLRDAEIHTKRVTGGTFWSLLSWEHTEFDGQPAMISWVYDISARKAAEAAVEEARKTAEHANQTKSEFLANMSHELRTPLNAIIGYAEMLKEDAQDQDLPDMVPDLTKIENAGRHLLKLINDILDLSKIEAGRMEVYLEPVNVAHLVEEVRALVTPLANNNGNALDFTVPPDLGVFRTDHTKLKQSLINLLSNACKFTKDGKVSLEVERADNGKMLHFRIVDTGIGMSEAQLGKLFQAFTQADSSTTRQFGGTGLGLVITQRFCHMLGGRVEVESAPGKGSTFTIVLPMPAEAETDATPKAAAMPSEGPVAGATVLLVDDDPQIHELLGAVLVREGYRVLHAANGREAVARARSDRPAAILLDIMMPQIDGWTVLSTLKQDDSLADIPVVVVSMLDERPLGLSLGAAEFLTKPVDRSKLLSTLAEQIGSTTGTILVVDDDERDRLQQARALETLGLDVAVANNGREALAWLARHPVPRAMILDLKMPELDGFEVLDALRHDDRLRNLPVIVLTAKDLTPAESDFLTGRGGVVITKGPQAGAALIGALGNSGRK